MTEERRPSFARDFPRGPELDALLDAFRRGDYARVRAEGPRLARSSDDEEICRAAETLVDRTRPDRLAVGLLVVTGVLLLALTGYWMVHGKPPPGSGPTTPASGHPR
jgi:hypothetical protein